MLYLLLCSTSEPYMTNYDQLLEVQVNHCIMSLTSKLGLNNHAICSTSETMSYKDNQRKFLLFLWTQKKNAADYKN